MRPTVEVGDDNYPDYDCVGHIYFQDGDDMNSKIGMYDVDMLEIIRDRLRIQLFSDDTTRNILRAFNNI